jgi:hypothetical protein
MAALFGLSLRFARRPESLPDQRSAPWNLFGSGSAERWWPRRGQFIVSGFGIWLIPNPWSFGSGDRASIDSGAPGDVSLPPSKLLRQ